MFNFEGFIFVDLLDTQPRNEVLKVENDLYQSASQRCRECIDVVAEVHKIKKADCGLDVPLGMG